MKVEQLSHENREGMNDLDNLEAQQTFNDRA